MGEIQTSPGTRKSSRLEVRKKTPVSGGKGKRTVDEVDRCNRRSLSSPPYQVRDCLIESQSGSDFDDSQDLYDSINSNFNEYLTPPEKNPHRRINRVSPSSPPTREAGEHHNVVPTLSPPPYTVPPSKNDPKHRKPKKEEQTHSVWIIVGIGTCVLTIGLFIIFVIKFEPGINNKTVKPKSFNEIGEDIFRDLDKLKSETKQDRKFWGEIYTGLATLTEPSPRQPAVLLWAVPQDGRRTAVCLAHHISDIVHKAFVDTVPPVKHDSRDYLQLPWDEHKLLLDNKLSNLRAAHAAVIYNMELLPALTATILHGYCDNDNAPYKRSVLLLLLELPLHQSSIDARHIEVTVERRLHQLWKGDLEEDHIPGLLSRVTSQTMMVLPESQKVLDSLCPT